MLIRGKISETLITAEAIHKRVVELGAQISKDFEGEEILGICLLKGSMIFTSDLVRQITVPLTLDLMRASSYEGLTTESSGSVKVLLDLDEDVSGKNVLIIEDIIDTGRTLKKIHALLKFRNPKTLKICTLLNKPSRRVEEMDIDYCGFTIEDLFVVGYGLDYDDYYRNIPYVGLLDPGQ